MIIAIIIIAGIIFLVVGVADRMRRRSKGLNTAQFTERWHELQKNCATRKTWPLAIIDADNLLDQALKGRRFKGKTTGERLVAAQHELTANNLVWFGHKLRNRIVHEDVRKLKKADMLEALSGFRQALRDLGALK
jgi:hypothetical protein